MDVDELSAALRTGVGRMHRRFRSERPDGDLGSATTSVLALLVKEGPRTLTGLSERERVRPATMSQTVNRLAALGYLERRPDPQDGRRVLFVPTAEGTAVMEDIRARGIAWLDAALAGVGDEDREVLARAAVLLRDLADA